MSILKDLCFEPIPENIPAIASGATPIGSTERAPDRRKQAKRKIQSSKQGTSHQHSGNDDNFDYIVDEMKSNHFHREIFMKKLANTTQFFLDI
jgi:hypothetical protein